MEITELVLKHYGKFDQHRISLQPGINIIYGGNETGKTTIHSFIRSMFFGLNRARGKASKTDEYQIRQPWDTPGAFLGSMRIREQGEIYRIDRCFDRSAPPLQVVCETRAEESANPQEDLNALLGGISENAFINTVFVRQAQCETDETFAEELRRYMVNSDRTMDADLDVTRALQMLRKKKKALEQKKKKESEQLENKIEKKQAQAEQIRSELEMLKDQRQVYYGKKELSAVENPYPSKWENWNSELEEAEYEEDDWDDQKTGRGRKILEILLFLAGMTSLGGAFLMQELIMKLFLGFFGAVFLGMIFVVHFLLGEPAEKEKKDYVSPEEEQNLAYLENEIQKRDGAYQKLQMELEALYQEHVRLDVADTESAAITLAIDRICELSNGIYKRTGGQLGERASGILNELTGGRYKQIVLDEASEVRIHTQNRVLGLHQVSGATMQQIYFALRMAAGELLSNGINLPVILDEPFALYDDERLESALRWLKNSGRQVILFTCQKREREILSRIEGYGGFVR